MAFRTVFAIAARTGAMDLATLSALSTALSPLNRWPAHPVTPIIAQEGDELNHLRAMMSSIRRGGDPAIADPVAFLASPEDGTMALHISVIARSFHATAALLGAGVDPNTADREGRTALHIAVGRSGFPEAVPLLLLHGACPLLLDASGNNAVGIAKARGASTAALSHLFFGRTQGESLESCAVCAMEGPLTYLPACGHRFCFRCVKHWLEEIAGSGGCYNDMTCPDVGCRAIVHPNLTDCFLKPELRARVEEKTVASLLWVGAKSGILGCPECGVSGGGWVQTVAMCGGAGGGEHTMGADPDTFCGDILCANGHTFCGVCAQGAHKGITCTESESYKTWSWAETHPFVRRCPNCSAVIEKNGGCYNVYCTACRTSIDWRNAMPVEMKKKRDPTDRIRVVYEDGWVMTDGEAVAIDVAPVPPEPTPPEPEVASAEATHIRARMGRVWEQLLGMFSSTPPPAMKRGVSV